MPHLAFLFRKGLEGLPSIFEWANLTLIFLTVGHDQDASRQFHLVVTFFFLEKERGVLWKLQPIL